MSKNWTHLITDRTKLIILNSPHNPTGGTLSKRDIKSITEVIGDRNIMVLSDEIYSHLMFDGAHHHSIMSEPGFKERTILLDGFYKTLLKSSGWRLGFGAMRLDLLTARWREAGDEFDFVYGELYTDCGHRSPTRVPSAGRQDANKNFRSGAMCL